MIELSGGTWKCLAGTGYQFPGARVNLTTRDYLVARFRFQVSGSSCFGTLDYLAARCRVGSCIETFDYQAAG